MWPKGFGTSLIPGHVLLVAKLLLNESNLFFLTRKNTPVGRGVLKAYFATVPSLPLLVWVNLHAGGQVFKFPSEQSITQTNILSWLEKLKAGLEIPSSKWRSI